MTWAGKWPKCLASKRRRPGRIPAPTRKLRWIGRSWSVMWPRPVDAGSNPPGLVATVHTTLQSLFGIGAKGFIVETGTWAWVFAGLSASAWPLGKANSAGTGIKRFQYDLQRPDFKSELHQCLLKGFLLELGLEPGFLPFWGQEILGHFNKMSSVGQMVKRLDYER